MMSAAGRRKAVAAVGLSPTKPRTDAGELSTSSTLSVPLSSFAVGMLHDERLARRKVNHRFPRGEVFVDGSQSARIALKSVVVANEHASPYQSRVKELKRRQGRFVYIHID